MHTSPWKCSSPGSSVIKAEEGQGDYTYQKQVNHGAQPSPSPYITTWLNLQRIWGGRKRSELKQRDKSPNSSLSPLPPVHTSSGLFYAVDSSSLFNTSFSWLLGHRIVLVIFLPLRYSFSRSFVGFSSRWSPTFSSLDLFLMSAHSLGLSCTRITLNTIYVLTISKFISPAQTSPLDSRLYIQFACSIFLLEMSGISNLRWIK